MDGLVQICMCVTHLIIFTTSSRASFIKNVSYNLNFCQRKSMTSSPYIFKIYIYIYIYILDYIYIYICILDYIYIYLDRFYNVTMSRCVTINIKLLVFKDLSVIYVQWIKFALTRCII